MMSWCVNRPCWGTSTTRRTETKLPDGGKSCENDRELHALFGRCLKEPLVEILRATKMFRGVKAGCEVFAVWTINTCQHTQKQSRCPDHTIPPVRTISFFELFSRFEFDFRRRGIFFERFEFLVCSKFIHMQRDCTCACAVVCDCTCACAVACLHPHNSISNVVVSVTIHDEM